VSRIIAILRVDRGPEFGTPAWETVDAEFARIRVPFHRHGAVKVGIRPEANALAILLDSFVVVDVRGLAEGDNSWNLAIEDEVGNVATAPIHVFRKVNSKAHSLDSVLAAAQDVAALAVDTPTNAPPVPGKIASTDLKDRGAADVGEVSIHVIRYRMLDGETIRKVSEKFYGTRDLDTVLIQWNGFLDSTKWRKMPIGTVVEVPFWTDLDQAKVSVRDAVKSFPWDKVPPSRRGGR
jgi:hypothetical protein